MSRDTEDLRSQILKRIQRRHAEACQQEMQPLLDMLSLLPSPVQFLSYEQLGLVQKPGEEWDADLCMFGRMK